MEGTRVNRRDFLKGTAFSVTLFLCLPGKALSRTQGIPVLLYHDISEVFDDDYTISPSLFSAHLTWLQANGYRTYFFSEIVSANSFADEKAVLITFDDGYASFMDYAFPLLDKYGFKATINVIGKYVGKTIEMGGERPMLDWEDYRHFARSAHVDIGCHTHNLHEWSLWKGDLSERTLHEDLHLFQETLRAQTGKKAEILAWPYGIYDRERMKVAKRAGFRYLLTSNDGYMRSASDLWEIPRQNMNDRSRVGSFATFVGGKG